MSEDIKPNETEVRWQNKQPAKYEHSAAEKATIDEQNKLHAGWLAEQNRKAETAGRKLSPDEIVSRAKGTETKPAV